MKQHRPRMSYDDYQVYKWMKDLGSLREFQSDYIATKSKEYENENELTKLRSDNKLAPLLALAGVAVGVLVGYLLWGV
jgi:hypothetical protein